MRRTIDVRCIAAGALCLSGVSAASGVGLKSDLQGRWAGAMPRKPFQAQAATFRASGFSRSHPEKLLVSNFLIPQQVRLIRIFQRPKANPQFINPESFQLFPDPFEEPAESGQTKGAPGLINPIVAQTWLGTGIF